MGYYSESCYRRLIQAQTKALMTVYDRRLPLNTMILSVFVDEPFTIGWALIALLQQGLSGRRQQGVERIKFGRCPNLAVWRMPCWFGGFMADALT